MRIHDEIDDIRNRCYQVTFGASADAVYAESKTIAKDLSVLFKRIDDLVGSVSFERRKAAIASSALKRGRMDIERAIASLECGDTEGALSTLNASHAHATQAIDRYKAHGGDDT
ncbi:MAG: hypothetical protein Q4C85_07105 [Actinomyces sp.]|uniref:hypothetical protein n=1 Tax=Actinomyces sp. TaxID=29317 RepID=UPI0026DB3425|nr:hypothetical protein [Actinomyces sp.]MDO4243510.1 hypothetical protein [Actinomyces sp.]